MATGLLALLKRARLDLSPLRLSRDFRLWFAGGAVTMTGGMVTAVTVPWQVAQLTGSPTAVGLLGVAALVPLLLTALWGGALADAHDRRRLALVTECMQVVLSALLLVNALLPEPLLWPLYVLFAGVAAVDGLQRPALDAMLPRLVPATHIPAANALDTLRGEAGFLIGPPLAGLLIAWGGVEAAYAFDVLSFTASIAALALMRPVPPDDARPASLRRIAEGWRYARSRQELLGTYAADIVTLAFAYPAALFPFVAERFGGPAALGWLHAATSAGAALAALTSGWIGHVHRHGRTIVLAAGTYGLAVLAFAFAGSLWIALAFLAVAGFADMVSGLFRQRVWNETIPDALRGRLAGIEQLSYSIGPTLGEARSGLTASAIGVRASLAWGGAFAVIGVSAVAAVLPRFWSYDARTASYLRARDRQDDAPFS